MPQLIDLLEQARHLYPTSIDLSLGRCHDLLSKLGNPHFRIPPVFHVAGTNGKGSTIAFAKQILEDNGYAVHTYTSPHLVRFNERIQLANWRLLFASDDAYDQLLADTLAEILQVNAGASVTHFEIITCLAFLLFSRYPADYVLLEVGLGGRYDATNVIENPIVTAITSISRDHVEYLGFELRDIALAKAGIIKQGVPIVIPHIKYEDALPSVVHDIITDRATIHNAPLVYASRENYLDLGLLGDHQHMNAAVALRMIYAANVPLTRPIEPSLQRTTWAGRLQKITCAGGWEFFTKGCSGGDIVWKQLTCDSYGDRENVDALCYKKCPVKLRRDGTEYSWRHVPGMPYLCFDGTRGLAYGRGVGEIPPIIRFGE